MSLSVTTTTYLTWAGVGAGELRGMAGAAVGALTGVGGATTSGLGVAERPARPPMEADMAAAEPGEARGRDPRTISAILLSNMLSADVTLCRK